MTEESATLSDLFPNVARPQRLSEHVYDELCEAIVEGKLPPGRRVRETEMADALGVSRTPVREAFMRLKQQRLLRSGTGRHCGRLPH
jgi:DNA-binding GntR family transcriptional regulator